MRLLNPPTACSSTNPKPVTYTEAILYFRGLIQRKTINGKSK